MTLIKKIKNIFYKKSGYYFSIYYYRQLLDKYTVNITVYLKLLNAANSFKNKLIAKEIISSYSKISFNYTINRTKKTYGLPAYTIINETVDDVIILFYRLKFGDEKVKCEFHFYKEELFYMKYIFSYLNPKQKESIINIIEKKYLDEKPFNYVNSVISDADNNKLFISEDSHFNIEYLAIDSSFYKNIKELQILNEKKTIEDEKRFLKQIWRRL